MTLEDQGETQTERCMRAMDSKIDALRDQKEVLISIILSLLDATDYTTGACQCTEMVGAVLDKVLIQQARKAIDNARRVK